MLLPIKPICDRKRVRRNGTSLVFIQYCKSAADKTILNTGIAIPPQYWNKKVNRISEKLPPEFGIPNDLNIEIQRQLRLAEDIVRFALNKKIHYPVNFLKSTFNPLFDLKDLEKNRIEKPEGIARHNKDFFFQMDEYIKSKQGAVAFATLQVFKNLKLILTKFQDFRNKKITFEEIDLNFYEEFIHYLTYEHVHINKKTIVKGFKTNSIGKTIKQLIVFIRNRKAKKIITDVDTTGFKIPEEDADAIYLSPEEIKQIINLDLANNYILRMHRDLFVFGCFTGLRCSDFSIIGADDVRDNMLYKKQGKTKHWVVIPLRFEAEII